jgi:hypothetical protein
MRELLFYCSWSCSALKRDVNSTHVEIGCVSRGINVEMGFTQTGCLTACPPAQGHRIDLE